jgi:hypothetical protein
MVTFLGSHPTQQAHRTDSSYILYLHSTDHDVSNTDYYQSHAFFTEY